MKIFLSFWTWASFIIWVKKIVRRSTLSELYVREEGQCYALKNLKLWLFLRSKGIRLKSELPAVNSGLKNLTQMNAVETVSKVLIKNFWEKNRSHCTTYAFYWVTCIVTSWGLCVIRLINHIKMILLNNHLNSVAFTVAILNDFTQNEFF